MKKTFFGVIIITTTFFLCSYVPCFASIAPSPLEVERNDTANEMTRMCNSYNLGFDEFSSWELLKDENGEHYYQNHNRVEEVQRIYVFDLQTVKNNNRTTAVTVSYYIIIKGFQCFYEAEVVF